MTTLFHAGLGALGLPSADMGAVLAGELTADAVILGLPFDAGVPGVPGQRHGPEIFRKLSPTHGWTVDASGALGGVIDPVTRGSVLSGRRVFDLGDLGAVPIDPRVGRGTYYRALARLSEQLAEAGALPVFIGGDHSLSAPAVTGAAAVHGPLRFLCFDAHCDFSSRPMPDVTDITHADFLGHLLQLGAISDAELYGVRTYLPADCRPLPDSLRCAYAYPHGPGAATASRDDDRPTYLSIDLDVIDPADFPATGHPEAGGYRLRELLAAVEHVCRTRRVVAVDIVEALQDDRENRATSATVSALVMTCLRALLEHPQERETTG
ncbi:arginase family protein [Streptomyces sp. NBC_01565]|uniref:arginase family protein n=1 Tax=unclassified Streptomyces TaxID=2593676 RepID=UPI002254CE8C|nr:arginase family protein [Streptomyces sp. NBC_01565]MCX4540026.1 arginase family protein [Streptomyces sp. NBC_01565]